MKTENETQNVKVDRIGGATVVSDEDYKARWFEHINDFHRLGWRATADEYQEVRRIMDRLKQIVEACSTRDSIPYRIEKRGS